MIPAIAAIAHQCRHELGYVMIPALRAAVQRDGVLVALDGVLVIGFAYVWWRRDRQATLHAIAVHPERRGQGAGLLLLDRLCREAIRRDMRTVMARCPEGLPANQWYEHCGFTLDGIDSGKHRRLLRWHLALPARWEGASA